MNERRKIKITKENSGKRIDIFLKNQFEKYSRSFIQYLIKENKVKINGIPTKKDYILKESDIIDIELVPPPGQEIKPEKIEIPIIYEDNSIIVVNKPSGMVVHPACGNYTGTLLQGLLYKFPLIKTEKSLERIGLVHRLDKETSGLLVVAKTIFAQKFIQKQFQNRTIKKIYLAIVKGNLISTKSKELYTIDAPLERNPYDRKKFDVVPYKKTARKAITQYKVLKTIEDYSLLEIFPLTGRTHQIRVHLSHIGHPVAGDKDYGKREHFKRTMLHAWKITLIHPETKEKVSFEAPIPEDFKNFLSY